MTGGEQLTVWLFGILMAAVTVIGVAKARSDARISAAIVQAEALQAWLERQFGAPLHVPADWTKENEQ